MKNLAALQPKPALAASNRLKPGAAIAPRLDYRGSDVTIRTFSRGSALLLSCLFCAARPVLAADTPYRSESFDATGLHAIQTQTSGGSIEVTGSDSGKATVDMYVTTSHGGTDPQEIEKRLSAYHISIVRDGDTLRAVSESHLDNWKSQLNISFRIHAPHAVDCTMQTSGGHLALSDVAGTQDLDTSGGGVRLEDVKGTTKASTSGGEIDIVHYNGKLKARTSGGHISTEQSEGDFDLETSGGTIVLDQVSGAITASTSGGSIRADVSRLTGALKLSTSGGDVRASVPRGHGFDLDLEGSSVKVDLANFSGPAAKDEVRGKVNGGGLPLQLTTSGGSVYLSFKDQK
jgi:hypothetical protein